MGAIRTIKNDDGRPYISLEDLIREIEDVKTRYEDDANDEYDKADFLNVVLKTLHQMEEEYYTKYLFRK